MVQTLHTFALEKFHVQQVINFASMCHMDYIKKRLSRSAFIVYLISYMYGGLGGHAMPY